MAACNENLTLGETDSTSIVNYFCDIVWHLIWTAWRVQVTLAILHAGSFRKFRANLQDVWCRGTHCAILVFCMYTNDYVTAWSWVLDHLIGCQLRILWNRNFHYRIYKSLVSVPILSQINPVHTCHPLTVTLILILSSHLKQGLPSGFLHPSLSTKALYKFLFSPHMPCRTHIIRGMEASHYAIFPIHPFPSALAPIFNYYPPHASNLCDVTGCTLRTVPRPGNKQVAGYLNVWCIGLGLLDDSNMTSCTSHFGCYHWSLFAAFSLIGFGLVEAYSFWTACKYVRVRADKYRVL